MNETIREAAQKALINAGVPTELASQCADIVGRDDPAKPDLGRSEDDQRLIEMSMKWVTAQPDPQQ